MTKLRIREIRQSPLSRALLDELLAELERIQGFTRKGERAPAAPKLPRAAKPPKTGSIPDPRIKLFIDEWAKEFERFHREKYMVQGGKDGAAAKRLVSLSSAPTHVENLIDTAWAAWGHLTLFNCKQAATIAGFASRYNDIRSELRAAQPKPEASAPAQIKL